MAKVNRTVLHNSVPTFQEFSTGGVVRTKYDLFKNKVGLWEWRGTFPKTVPAGSTPESTGGIWSDTNPDGLWVNIGDASLRGELKSGDGSLIGVGNGETLKERLEKLHTNVTPEMFILAPEVTHNRAFEEMFTYAKEKGVKVEGVGQYVLEATESGIDITVDTDFSKASILCSTKEDVPQWQQRTRIFSVNQVYEDISQKFSNVSILKNAKSFPVYGLSGHITILSEDVVMLRYDGDTPEPQKKAEANQIFSNGMLKYDQYYNFSDNKKVYYKPHMPELNIKIGSIVLDGAFIHSILSCYRNNTNLSINKILSINEGHAQAYVEQESCSNFSYNNAIYDLDYNPENLGGYALTYKYTTNTRISRVTDIHGWAGTDGNYARDIKAIDCDLLTVGGHFSMSDISVISCTIRNHCTAQGWGVFELIDCKHILPDGDVRQMTLGTRHDYANSWDGVLRVKNLSVYLGNTTKQYSIVSAQEPKQNHQFMSQCPDIEIDGVTIATTRVTDASGMEIRGIDLGVSKGKGYEKYQYLPRIHSIKNVTFGDIYFFNRIDFRPVYNNRNYSTITVSEFSIIRKVNYTYTVIVENLTIEKAGKSDFAGYFGVHSFDFPSESAPYQCIYITRANNCIPVLKADTKIIAEISHQQQNFCAVDARRDKTVKLYNQVQLNHVTVYEPRVYNAPDNGRPCLLYFIGCKFDWLEFSPFTTHLSVSDYKIGIGSKLTSPDSALVVLVQACYGRLEGGDRSMDTTFKGWITNGFRQSNYII